MTKQQLTEWIETGRELEFAYHGKKYSITYYNDNRKNYISFCEFNKETLDVKEVSDLWNGLYKGMRVSEILESVPESDVFVF